MYVRKRRRRAWNSLERRKKILIDMNWDAFLAKKSQTASGVLDREHYHAHDSR